MMQCPRQQKLCERAGGLSNAEDSRLVDEHLKSCAACAAVVALHQADETLLAQLRQAAGYAAGQSVRDKLAPLLAGQYELLEIIGKGAYGTVFKARDIHLDRLVAIKCPTAASIGAHAIAVPHEARLLARVNHPNIATIYCLSDQTDPPFMVMEFVDGQPIDRAAAHLNLADKLSVFSQVLRAVAELHRRGIVHRDLKPGNVLVDQAGLVKVLDMGIAEEAAHIDAVAIRGTPAYMSPQQALGQRPKPTDDVFALGVILFEILTSQRPFSGSTASQTLHAIRQSDPPLPRTLNSEIPGSIQAICLTALEKDPRHRYGSADSFLRDIERFQDGEAVSANPTLLGDILEHGIERHISELSRWQKDRLISPREYDYFIDKYEHLRQHEEFWMLDARRISFSQVVLHLGAWSCIVAAFLMRCFAWQHLANWQRVAVPMAVLAGSLVLGQMLWRWRIKRIAVVMLLAAALSWPLLAATVFDSTGWLTSVPLGQDLLLPLLNNVQFLLTASTSAAMSFWFWRQTRTSIFSLVLSVSLLLLATAIFAPLGLRDLLERQQYDKIAGWYIAPGLLILAIAMALDLRLRKPHLAGPFYIDGILVLIAAMTTIAKYGPLTKWLGLDIKYGIEYSFAITGLAYLLAGAAADRSAGSYWLRRIATLLFWLAPSHILIPILSLELDGAWAASPADWTLPQILLPLAALGFVFGSVPKQMKSFFFSGLFYAGAGIQRLTARHFEDVYAWPVALAAFGFLLMVIAWRRPGLLDRHGQLKRFTK